MKYLPKETCEYLVSLGCVSESGKIYLCDAPKRKTDIENWRIVDKEDWKLENVYAWQDAFSFEDILRKDNAEKIWGDTFIGSRSNQRWQEFTRQVLVKFQWNPNTWPEEVAKLIKP